MVCVYILVVETVALGQLLMFIGGRYMYELFTGSLGQMGMDDAYSCFIAAVKHKIDKEGTKQVDLAEAVGTSPQHLNAVINEREGRPGKKIKAGMELQQAIAEYFGYSLVQFLELGQQVLENLVPSAKPERPARVEPELDDRYDMSIPLIGEELDAIHQITKTMQRLHTVGNWWKSVFDAVPTPLIVLKADKTVIYNNRRNQQLFAKTRLGVNLCDACHTDMDLAHPCTEDDDNDCPIDKVARGAATADLDVWIKGNYYSVNAASFTSGGESYIFVATIPINKIAKAESKIESMSQEIHWLMHDHPWPILFADADKVVKYYNRRLQKLFNVDENHLKRSEDFWLMCSTTLRNPAEVIAESKRCRAEQADGCIAIEMLNNDQFWMIFTPAFGHHGEFLGIQVKVLDEDEYIYYKHCLGGGEHGN